jgi:threonine synthase
VVAAEREIVRAAHAGPDLTGIDADATGTAGLAGLLRLVAHGAVGPEDRVAVLFTGRSRNPG